MKSVNTDSDKAEYKTEDKITTVEDCFSCKLISSTALLVASSYVFTRALQAKLRFTKFISIIFGTSLGYTGIARFMDWQPFNVTAKIDQPVQNSE